MEQRTYHGPITVDDLTLALLAAFDHGNLQAQAFGDGGQRIVQIASRMVRASGGATAVSVHLAAHEDGVLVRVGQQQWLGVAASLGVTALTALRNPLSLLGRLDDVAQDVASLQLSASIWAAIDRAAAALGASHELSERLRRLECAHCRTANPVGEPRCIACGAPLGPSQPRACPHCGFVSPPGSVACGQCGRPLPA